MKIKTAENIFNLFDAAALATDSLLIVIYCNNAFLRCIKPNMLMILGKNRLSSLLRNREIMEAFKDQKPRFQI